MHDDSDLERDVRRYLTSVAGRAPSVPVGELMRAVAARAGRRRRLRRALVPAVAALATAAVLTGVLTVSLRSRGNAVSPANDAHAPTLTLPSATYPSRSATSPTPAPTAIAAIPAAVMAEVLRVAARVLSPSGASCDTHRDNAASDVNACPYSDRLKAFVNARYALAWVGRANPNPVLSALPPCSDGKEHVSYTAAFTSSGETVSLTTCSGTGQKLVLADVGGSLVVDDILSDVHHDGTFTSIYSLP